MSSMWDMLPAPLRRLFGRKANPDWPPYDHNWEWNLYYMAYRLGLDMATAYRLMDGRPMPPRYRYHHFAMPKKDGTPRRIVEPGPTLKIVQRKLLELYLSKPKPHPATLGFRRKKSIADHAWTHAGASIIITADIEDFFPNTLRRRVKGWWRQQGYSTLEVRLLTSLTTYRGCLPQGAPTSPMLSNLVNYEMDAALERCVRQSGGKYTRYADDLVFSWPEGNEPPADFEQVVRAILRASGYALHPRKGWRVWRRSEEPEVTGLVLRRRGGVDLPDSMRGVMRLLAASNDPGDQRRLAGYRGYESMVRRRV
jgi:RNA-directed DNA polymerase